MSFYFYTLLITMGLFASNSSHAFPPMAPLKVNGNLNAQPYLQLVNVLGEEDRFNIPNESGYFTDMGGLLTMKFSEGSFTCTGYLIGYEWVLTASHCVYNIKTGEAAQEITFDLAQVERHDFLHPREYGSKFWILKDLIGIVKSGQSEDRHGPTQEYMEKDFAVIHIPKLEGRRRILGNPLPMQVVRSPEKTIYMQTAGYPSDKDSGTFWFTNCTGEKDPIYQLLNTQCDAVPGQSGSAVVQIWSPDELKGIDYPVPNKPALIGVISSVSRKATYVSELSQSLIDEIKGLIGKTNHSFTSFKEFKVKKNLENRMFVNNNCKRDISVFIQRPIKENGKKKTILDGFTIPAGKKSFLVSSTFASAQVVLQPDDIKKVKLYRQTDSWDDPVPLGPLKKILVQKHNQNFSGYDYELGKIWTDSKLILECGK
jgi:V8-like Glu-specific endopeptidase